MVAQLPEELGGGLTLRLNGNDDDKKRGLNRAENLRAIPPSDRDLKRLFARRNDAESINRGLEAIVYVSRGVAAQITSPGRAELGGADDHARVEVTDGDTRIEDRLVHAEVWVIDDRIGPAEGYAA